MSKTVLITGSTDGIGLLAAQTLAAEGHRVLLHGRSVEKLEAAKATVGDAETYRADLAHFADVKALAARVRDRHERLDVLINNAGVYKTPTPRTAEGLDVRFVVNTLAPYVLTQRLLPIIPPAGRIVNVSSAAQAPVDPAAMAGHRRVDDFGAYAQSKLAITIWTREMAAAHPEGPAFLAVNPGSLLASKMVKEGFGVAGKDLSIGADILCKAALDDAFAHATGRYYDNDAGAFGHPHAAADDAAHARAVMEAIESLVAAAT